MSTTPDLLTSPALSPQYSVERRVSPRIQGPFKARARSKDGSIKVDNEAVIRDLSPSACYLYLEKQSRRGDKFLVVTRVGECRVALSGRVLRVERQPGGRFGMAVEIARYRFF